MLGRVLVIGSGGDIGGSIVRLLGDTGWDVTGTERNDLDLANDDSIERFIAEQDKAYNHIIFAAATNVPKPFIVSEHKALEQAVRVNILSFLSVLRSLVKEMEITVSPSVIMIGSLFGQTGREGRLPYSLSKHAMMGVCKTLAIELAPFGVRVNTVSPGFIDTKLTRRNVSDENILRLENKIPMGRLGSVDEIANVVEFLISPKASYINGIDIVVDGGFIAGGFYN